MSGMETANTGSMCTEKPLVRFSALGLGADTGGSPMNCMWTWYSPSGSSAGLRRAILTTWLSPGWSRTWWGEYRKREAGSRVPAGGSGSSTREPSAFIPFRTRETR